MNRKNLLASLGVTVGLATIAASVAIAQQPQDSKSPAGAAPEMQLPPGWTEADMQACMIAGTPGAMHEHLAKDVGTWRGKSTMWMGSGSEPMKTETTSTITSVMDGRYVRCEIDSDMPGMGPFHGEGVYGYDNVTEEFVANWIDNHSTGIMTGTGELSADGKTLTWTYTYNCPINNRPTTMREVEKATGPNTKTIEMFGADPKTGEEYRMMLIELTKQS